MVKDNGIGLAAAKELKNRSQEDHESLAISIVKERLDMLSRKRGTTIDFTLREYRNNKNEVGGTEVLFRVPFN
jgi:hypothetical protein